jgi:hypothetical protein
MNEKMTAEKAIEQLNSLMNDRENHVHRDDFDDVFLQDIEACKMGIQALEKQVLKKPIVKLSYICGKKYYCSECKHYICADCNTKKSYCSNCGQALDWSDNDE